MSPIGWAARPLYHYAKFTGRAPRAEYWWFVLFTGVAGLVLGMVDGFALGGPIYGSYGPLGLALVLICIVPGLAVLVRRLHDTDRTGWWAVVRIPTIIFILSGWSPLRFIEVLKTLPLALAIVVGAVLIIAGFAVFFFVVTEGDGGPNRYGPDPYGPDELEAVFT